METVKSQYSPSALLNAFKWKYPAMGDDEHERAVLQAYDAFLQANSFVHVEGTQRLLSLKPDGWFGPASARHVAALVQAPASSPNEPRGLILERRIKIPPRPSGAIQPCRQSVQLAAWGAPGKLSVECSTLTNPLLVKNMITAHVGGESYGFNVTGLRQAVESFDRILEHIALNKPELAKRISTAGMFCCRAVRGSTVNFSNHSFGTAIDLKIDGVLDKPGDGFCLPELANIAQIAGQYGWSWGGWFSNEDAMHFEAGEALVKQWAEQAKR
jgi:hypothetical protein